MSEQVNQADAIKILIRAVQVAQSKGVYNLNEAATIHRAVSAFINTEALATETMATDGNQENLVNDTTTVNEP